MKLVVGLGNPGKEYENTRHNIGYELADMFAKKYDCSFRTERKFEADIFDININGEKVIDVDAEIDPSSHFDGKFVIVRRGKKRYFLVRVK